MKTLFDRDLTVEDAKILIKKGFDPDSYGNCGMNAMHLRAADGEIELVKVFLDSKFYDVDVRDYDGFTSLHYAASNGRFEIVKLLLNEGADEDAETEDGETALYLASREERGDYIKVMNFLIDKGVNNERTF